MNDFDQFYQDEPQQEPDWLKKLRADARAYEALTKKAQGRKPEDLIEGYFKLETEKRTSSLADLLKSKGVDPRAARFFPRDTEPSEENLAKWLDGEGELFKPAPKADEGQSQTQTAPGPDGGQQQTQQTQTQVPEWMQQFARIHEAETAGDVIPPSVDTAKQTALANAFENAKSSQDFLNFLRQGGAG